MPFKLPFWVVIFAYLVSWPAAVSAKAVFAAEVGTVNIVLHDEPCELKMVSNLPYKSTWHQDGKQFHGCWGVMGEHVGAYFVEDMSFAIIPVSVFKRLVGV
jgi:hypothetical protein